MAKKYIKNENGIVRAVTSDNLQLEKPLVNENYDIEVHNRNMDKIDSAIQEVKGKIDGLELVASKVAMADGSTVEATITTNKSNISTLQSEVSANKTSILNNTELANQALTKANEAFQRGDNVKTQLVDKLISEGLNVSTNNTFEELIGNIALGKKWAMGLFGPTNIAYNQTIEVSYNFGFVPKTIIMYGTLGEALALFTTQFDMAVYSGSIARCVSFVTGSSKNIIKESEIDIGVDTGKAWYVRSNGFKLVNRYYNSDRCYWLAFE